MATRHRYSSGVLIRNRLEDLPALGLPLHLALGVFDGVHVGHQAVIERAVTEVLAEGKTLPVDQGGSATTQAVGAAIAKRAATVRARG